MIKVKILGMQYIILFFSSFSANVKVHLEDLFIKPNYRHQGYGKEFFFKLAKIIKEEGYIGIEWSCLDWNVPSIEFYKRKLM